MSLDGWTLAPWAGTAPGPVRAGSRLEALRLFLGGGWAVAACEVCGPLLRGRQGAACALEALHALECRGRSWVTPGAGHETATGGGGDGQASA